jgi:D-alanyl-D-alanine carboxypeptidase
MALLTDKQIIEKYGQPGNPDNFTIMPLPYPMRIAWDTKTQVRKMQCHEDAEQKFLNVFNLLLAHYGLEDLQRLNIDLFGGCYNFRLMRGSKTRWSRHSWSIAIDLAPQYNQLKWGKDKALFAKPEYKPLMDIFYANDFANYGIEKGFDYQHFELVK